MKVNGSQHKKDANRPYAKKMPEASDKGSQPYSRAYRYGEMAGQSDTTPKTLPLPMILSKHI